VQKAVLDSVPNELTLKTREFKELKKSKHRFKCSLFIAQWDHCPGQPGRYGLIVTKKNGNAVVRNFIKRRLKEAFRQKKTILKEYRFVFICHRSLKDAHFLNILNYFDELYVCVSSSKS
jgi:ribonuclease P protein component